MEEKGRGQRKKGRGRRRGRERKTETEKRRERKDRKHVCTRQEREQKERKMVSRGQKSLGVGVACPLKGPETKRNNTLSQKRDASKKNSERGTDICYKWW